MLSTNTGVCLSSRGLWWGWKGEEKWVKNAVRPCYMQRDPPPDPFSFPKPLKNSSQLRQLLELFVGSAFAWGRHREEWDRVCRNSARWERASSVCRHLRKFCLCHWSIYEVLEGPNWHLFKLYTLSVKELRFRKIGWCNQDYTIIDWIWTLFCLISGIYPLPNAMSGQEKCQ